MSQLLLTPFMEIALRTMRRVGPIAYADGWWRSPDGRRQFNTHTIGWMAARGYCDIDQQKRATITRGGIHILSVAERLVA